VKLARKLSTAEEPAGVLTGKLGSLRWTASNSPYSSWKLCPAFENKLTVVQRLRDVSCH